MARLLPPERDIGVLRAPVRSSVTLVGLFVFAVLAVELINRIGVKPGFAPFAIVSAAFAVFVLAALYAHSRRAADFYVADRKIPGALGGVAAATVLAGLLTLGLAGGAYGSMTSFLVTAIGLAVGYLVLASVIAPRLRAFGAYSAGDFIALRFNSTLARFVWAMVAFSVSFLLVVAALKIAAPLVATLLGITPAHALYLAAGVTVMATLPGGMRSLTWTQAVQYFVIALAAIVPTFYFGIGEPATQSPFTDEFGKLLTGSLPAWEGGGAVGWALPFLVAAFGAAALPLTNQRLLAARSGRQAAATMLFAVLFAAVLVLAGLGLYELVVVAAGHAAPQGAASGLDEIAAALAALPSVLVGLVLAGALAALFALGQAALFGAATALSHDIWDEIIDRKGPEGRRIMLARLTLMCVAAGAVALVRIWPADAAHLAGWALALAGAGGFFPLVVGLWWRRCNEIGAIGGMVAGFGFTGVVFLLGQHLIPAAMVTTGWSSVGAAAAASTGLLMSLAVTIGLSFVTPAPEADGENPTNGSEERLPIRERPA